MRSLWIVLSLPLLSASPSAAVPLTVDFLKAIVAPSTEVPLPFFAIPEILDVAAINWIDIEVYDETGHFQFAIPGTNIDLGVFGPKLNGTDTCSPLAQSLSLSSCQIAQGFSSLLDSGDFLVARATVSIDANSLSAPEPATLVSVAGAMLLAGLWRARRSQ